MFNVSMCIDLVLLGQVHGDNGFSDFSISGVSNGTVVGEEGILNQQLIF